MKFLSKFHHCCLLTSTAAEEEIFAVPAAKYSCERNGLISSNTTSSSGYRHRRRGLSVISEKDVVSFSVGTSKRKSSVNDHNKAAAKPKSMVAKARSSYGHGNHTNDHHRNDSMEMMMIPGFAPAPFIF